MLGGSLSLLASVHLLAASDPAPQERRPSRVEEYEARAAFLLSLAKFTEWPAETLPPGEPFVIGVLGEGPLTSALESLAPPILQGHRVIIRTYRTASEVQPCAILYFPATEERHLGGLQSRLAGHGVLTVGETSFFLGSGGIVQVFSEDGRLRFALNRTALDRSKLRMSAQVQRLAKRVIQVP